MSAWSWSDVQRSEPAPGAKPKSASVKIVLTPVEADRLDAIAGNGRSRSETARRLLVAVLEDDAAAHPGGSE